MSFLGRFLVEQGAITEAQLADGLRHQQETNRRIGEVAVDRGVLTPGQVHAICQRQVADPRLFGDIAVDGRHLSRRDLDGLLFFQKVQHTYLGEALLVLGHISSDQYQQLMGRYWPLRDEGRVSLRYLQDFFAENKVVETLFAALAREVRRFAGEELAVTGLGVADAVSDFPRRALLTGTVLDGRRLAAAIGLSEALAGRIAHGLAESAGATGPAGIFDTVLRFFGDMLRDGGLRLEHGRVAPDADGSLGGRETLGIRGAAPSGGAGMVFWLEERSA